MKKFEAPIIVGTQEGIEGENVTKLPDLQYSYKHILGVQRLRDEKGSSSNAAQRRIIQTEIVDGYDDISSDIHDFGHSI